MPFNVITRGGMIYLSSKILLEVVSVSSLGPVSGVSSTSSDVAVFALSVFGILQFV